MTLRIHTGVSVGLFIAIVSTFLHTIHAAKWCNSDSSLCVNAIANNDTATFTMTTTTKGWAAVGVNSGRGMLGADMMVGWFNNDGSATISARRATAYALPTPYSTQFATVNSTASTLDASERKLVFSRPLVTSESGSIALVPDQSQYWIFAYGKDVPTSSDPVQATFNVHIFTAAPEAFVLLTQQNSSDPSDVIYGDDSETARYRAFVKVHGSLMFLGWALLIPVGIFLGQFSRDQLGPLWFKLHVAAQFVATILIIIAFAFIVSAVKPPHFDGFHQLAGLILFCCLFLQIPIGIYIHYRYDPLRTHRPFRNHVHRWFGRILALFSIAVISCGLDTYYNTASSIWALWGVWIGLLVLVFAGMMVYQRVKASKRRRTGYSEDKRTGRMQDEDSALESSASNLNTAASSSVFHSREGSAFQ